jgi:Fusaric acid resistance protein-like
VIERMAVLFRSKPDSKLNPVKGIYTALAIFLPLIILARLGYNEFGVLVMLGALLTSFGDVGRSYHIQARSMGMTAIGGTIMTALGRIVGEPWWVALLALFLVVFISGMFSVYGQTIAAVGLLLTIPFVISLGMHGGGPTTALPAAAGYLLGGVILLLFALLAAFLKHRYNVARDTMPSIRRARSTLSTLTSQFTFASPRLRYTLLRAIGTVSAVAICWKLGGAYPYWAALTVLVCARQNKRMSQVAALQYGIATIMAALIAQILIMGVQSLLALGLIVVAITFFAFTIKDRNYTVYIFFLTTLTLLLISIGTAGASFSVWRIVATLVGIAIVLVIILLNQVLALAFENRTQQAFLQ